MVCERCFGQRAAAGGLAHNYPKHRAFLRQFAGDFGKAAKNKRAQTQHLGELLLLLHIFESIKIAFNDMKKIFFGLLAGAAFTLSMASCGEKLLTDEQVKSEIDKRVAEQKAIVEKEEAANCDARFEQAVTVEVQRMQDDAASMKAAEEAAKPAKK